ncbi:MAG: hypothetical protein ACWGOW_07600, partial [Gammaproteobacteria bacterium]
MNNNYSAIFLLVSLCWISFNSASGAEQAAPATPVPTTTPTPATTPAPATLESETARRDILEGKFTEKGADTCIRCHDEDADYPVFDIFKTKHGQQGDKRSPFAQLQC